MRLTLCAKGRRSISMGREHTLDRLEPQQTLTRKVPSVVQPVFSVHSLEFGPPGQIGQPMTSHLTRILIVV